LSDPLVIWVVMGLTLCAYALTGGADFGGGVWTLLARGPHAPAERRAVEQAIAPIWEANHVWLIVLVVLMFTAFPQAFAAIGVALHIPITLALVGIVLRGAAFVFHAYGLGPGAERALWRRLFAGSSAMTPPLLGAVLAAMASGAIRVSGGHVTSGFFAGWCSWFALATGALALATFTLTAAAYLAVDAPGAVRPAFARKARASQVAVVACAVLAALAAHADAPEFASAFQDAGFAPAVVGTAAAGAVTAWLALGRGAPRLARAAVIVQVVCLVAGWGLGMDGHLLRPDVAAHDAGARARTTEALVPILAVGALVLAPSLWYLLRVFRRR
jgi:cytochrome d ubiquinol oxidase subunit II